MSNTTTINARIAKIFNIAANAVKHGDYEKMETYRKVLNEFVRDKVTTSEVLRDFDGTMNYYYNLYHSL